jgi:hypothetical protein
MARYKHYDHGQTKLLPVSFAQRILPGIFEYTLNCLIDERIELSIFEARYTNDAAGTPAYDPAILLKIVLYAYSKALPRVARSHGCVSPQSGCSTLFCRLGYIRPLVTSIIIRRTLLVAGH